MTGITNEMVAHAPGFAEVAVKLEQLLQGYLFNAHNARFDFGFLKNEFAHLGMTFRPAVMCTVKLSRQLYPQYRHHNFDPSVLTARL